LECIGAKCGRHWRVRFLRSARFRIVRKRSKLAAAIPFIDAVLKADRKAPRKQRHTAHRIWARIVREMPEVEDAESSSGFFRFVAPPMWENFGYITLDFVRVDLPERPRRLA
jgi:hypothetical protein